MHRVRLALLSVACAFCCCAARSSHSTACTGYELGLALVDQTIKRVAVAQTVNLADFQDVLLALTTTGPFTLNRSIELYNPGGSLVTVDMAYLGGLMKLQSGVTVTFTGLQVKRAEVQMFSASTGAAVVLQDNSELHLQVTVPNEFKQAFFSNAARPGQFPGTQRFNIESASGTVTFIDEAFNVPFAHNKGGFDMHFVNSRLAADTTTNLPTECTGPGSGLPGYPSSICIAAAQNAVKAQLCELPECIHTCRDGCAAE